MSERIEDATGLPLTCQHPKAVDNFNKGVEAYVSLLENPAPWFHAALEEDNSLVIAHSLLGFFLLFSLHSPIDPNVLEHLQAVERADQLSLHEREMAYVRSFQAFCSGNLPKAAEILIALLVDHPSDAVAVHLLTRSFIILGQFERLRDTMAWVLSFWQEDMKFYSYLLAFYSYALEECNQREKAETLARRALDLNAATPFAYHAMAHVMEEEKQASEGVTFFNGSRENWISSVYGVHLTWHLALYHLDLGDTESVLREFDSVILDKVSPDSMTEALDASSLLWRLSLAGTDPGEERWDKVTSVMATHVYNHQSPWFTAHIMMSLARGNVSEATARLRLAQAMLQSLDDFVREDGGVATRKKMYQKFGIPVCKALLAFGKGRYEEVLQIMLPLRHDLVRMGGSWAQRQIFNVTMIEAAVQTKDVPTALGLVAELRARKPCNRTLQLLFQRLKEEYEELRKQPPAKKIKI